MRNPSDAMVLRAIYQTAFSLAKEGHYTRFTFRNAIDDEGCGAVFCALAVSADLL
jgi:hypothetical protein